MANQLGSHAFVLESSSHKLVGIIPVYHNLVGIDNFISESCRGYISLDTETKASTGLRMLKTLIKIPKAKDKFYSV